MTKSQVENISETKKKITIQVPKELVNKGYTEAYKNIKKKAQIKGFRKGKIPDSVIDQYYGSEVDVEGLDYVIKESYGKVLDENRFFPLVQPKFDIKPLVRNQDYGFEVEIEVRPTVELKEYVGIKIKKKEAKVESSEIQEELKKLQNMRAEMAPAKESVLAVGHVATIDFEGTMDGVPFQGGSAKGYNLEYGKGYFIKELEDKMAGMKSGEERLIDMTFPEDYFEKSLAGKPAQFRIKIVALHDKVLPTLDDEFAKDLGKDTLEALTKEVETTLLARKEQGFRSEYLDLISDVLDEQHKQLEVPQGLLEEEVKRTGKSAEEISKSLRLQFVLEAVAQKEDVKIEAADVENRFRQLSVMYRQPVDVIKKYYQQNNMIAGLVSQLALEKTLDFLLDKAVLE